VQKASKVVYADAHIRQNAQALIRRRAEKRGVWSESCLFIPQQVGFSEMTSHIKLTMWQ